MNEESIQKLEKLHADGSFIRFLQDTLIPDLRESGRDCTADDFCTCIQIIDSLVDQINNLQESIDGVMKINKTLSQRATNSLANNLCPDHRDKQAGKSCLACEIEQLNRYIKKLQDHMQRCPNAD